MKKQFKPFKIKFLKSGYEPFLPKGIYTVVRYEGLDPIIKDRSGYELRLNKRSDYQIKRK